MEVTIPFIFLFASNDINTVCIVLQKLFQLKNAISRLPLQLKVRVTSETFPKEGCKSTWIIDKGYSAQIHMQGGDDRHLAGA